MSWYYTQGGQQTGPITEAQFEASVQSGVINADTLVWREGFAQWCKYSEVGQNGAGVAVATATRCTECGGGFSQDEMVNFAGAWVCAACKPQYVQKIKEGIKVGDNFVYAGFWMRLGAKILDSILTQIISGALGFVVGLVMRGDSAAAIVGGILGFAIGLGYPVFFLGKFGATPGKMALNVKVVRSNGEPISYGRALGRTFAEMLSGLILCIGYLMVAWDPEKRALHDRICDTRVIKR